MAGITHLKEFQQPALRGLVDETIKEAEPTLGDTYLPDENTYDTNFTYDIIKTNKYIGAMIGYGSEPPVIDRNAVANMHAELGKMGLKSIVTEEELLKLHQSRSNGEKASMIDSLAVDGIELVQAIQRRVAITKMEALTKGNFVYNKNGVKVEVDFGIPAENKVALTGDNAWTNPEADVIGDLLDFVQTYENANGEAPSTIYLSREVQALLLKNTTIVTEVAGAGSGRTRVSVDELNSVLGGYGLPSVQVVTDRKATVQNVYTGETETIEFFPVNRIVMLSEGIGNYLYGPTVENDFEPGIVLEAKDKDEPIQSIFRAVAAGFPMIEQPSRIFHADVYTA